MGRWSYSDVQSVQAMASERCCFETAAAATTTGHNTAYLLVKRRYVKELELSN